MSALAISTHAINAAFVEMLRPFTAKEVAARLKLPSWRTVENWKEGKTSPQAKHVAAMLQDDELSPALLTALGRADLATRARMLAKLRETRDVIDGALE